MRTQHEAKRITGPGFVRLTTPPNTSTRNYFKVTLYGPEPTTGRRAIIDEVFFFFDDQNCESTERARGAALYHAGTWKADTKDKGHRVIVSLYDAHNFPAVATLTDRDVRPIFLHICRVFGCFFPATLGGLCFAGHPGVRRHKPAEKLAA